MKKAINRVSVRARLCVCAAAVLLLAGCLAPHTSTKFPEVRGKVFNARDHAPIEGAKVFFYDHPATSTMTDSTGYFHLKEKRNFHLLRLPPGDGTWPRGTSFDVVVVSHTNYLRYQFYALEYARDQKGEVFLKPKP